MAYTILVNDDNTLYGSHKERIMQRSKLVDKLIFVVDPIYKNEFDMTDASVMMEYILPVSREYKTVNLVLSEERYNDCFLQYKLPFDTDITSQAGNLELQLTFVYVEMNENGVGIQRVRKTSPTTIEIIPISAWSDIVPDSALSALDQRLIKLDSQMRGLNDFVNILSDNSANDLEYNKEDETLKLTSNGKPIGKGVSVKDMIEDGVPVVDLNSSENTDTDTDNNGCSCGDCGCDDNVVEFGNSIGNETKPKDDSDVVEF